jgi:hypothetical protein
MPTVEFLRQTAQEVRALIALAKTREVIAQLEIWAAELEEEGDLRTDPASDGRPAVPPMNLNANAGFATRRSCTIASSLSFAFSRLATPPGTTSLGEVLAQAP